jgi:hypothetical protein
MGNISTDIHVIMAVEGFLVFILQPKYMKGMQLNTSFMRI